MWCDPSYHVLLIHHEEEDYDDELEGASWANAGCQGSASAAAPAHVKSVREGQLVSLHSLDLADRHVDPGPVRPLLW